MEMTPTVLVIIVLICFCGGLLNGLAGFGGLVLVIPAMALVLGMGITIPVAVLCGVAIQAFNSYLYRAHVQKKPLSRMIIGALPGIWLGSSLLIHLPEPLLRFLLGLLLIVYVLLHFLQRTPVVPTKEPATPWAWVTGFFSGGFGAAFGISGPPVVIYLTRTNWTPEAIRAFIAVFCGLIYLTTAVVMLGRGLITPEIWNLAALAIPCCLAGGLYGRHLASRMDARQYMRLIFLLLFVMGATLCWPAVRLYILSA
jgi:hypothetical protein